MTRDQPHVPADLLALSSPDALVAALPYLIGFDPVESIVVLWLSGRRLLLTQRVDLPGSAREHEAWSAAIWSHLAARQADEMVIALVTEREDAGVLAEVAQARAGDAEVGVRDVLVIRGGLWRSLLCSDPECCDPAGRRVDEAVAARIAAEFTGVGVAPQPDRGALVVECERDAALAARLATLVESSRRPPGRGIERWRDTAIARVREWIADDSVSARRQPLDDELLALTVAAVEDIRVRDTVLWHVSRSDADTLARAWALASAALRGAPDGLVAPVATVAAVAAWLLGDGARAQIALERALADQSGYSLAVLVRQSIAVGLPPQSWREAMSMLTRRDCRYGDSGRRRPRRAA